MKLLMYLKILSRLIRLPMLRLVVSYQVVLTHHMFQLTLPTKRHLQLALTLVKSITKFLGLKNFQRKSVLNTIQRLSAVKNFGVQFQRFSTIWTSLWLTQAVLHFTLYLTLQVSMLRLYFQVKVLMNCLVVILATMFLVH